MPVRERCLRIMSDNIKGIIGKISALLFTGFVTITASVAVYAMGNHPESNTCPADKPYYVFCADSMHGLEGWFGACYSSREQADQAAAEHAKQQHNGNTRWTGVRKIRLK